MKFWDVLMERYVGAARRALGEAGDQIWKEGQRLSFETAVDGALSARPGQSRSLG